MAAELRSPHQRRSDHLSILTRRQPPPQTPGRFSKTFVDCAVGTFDPTFDSDADTEGPASGSSIWRRDFSRVMSTSSAASASMSLDQIDSSAIAAAARNSLDALAAKPCHNSSSNTIEMVDSPPISPRTHIQQSPSLSQLVHHSPPPIDPVFSSDEPDAPDVFTRDRATSFYGREHTDDESSGKVGPLSTAQLKQVLDEDYDLFYTPSRTANPKDDDCNKQQNSSPNPDSPVLDQPPVSANALVIKEHPVGELTLADVSTHRSIEDLAPASSRASTDLSRKVRSYKLFSETETLTVSIVSDETEHSSSEDGYGLTRPELNELLQTTLTQRPRLSSGTGAVPLFVEEIGHLPRAAIVDGKVQRVKVANKLRGSSIRFTSEENKQWLCSLKNVKECFGKDKAEKKAGGKRKRSKRRRKRGRKSGRSQNNGARRSTLQSVDRE